MTEKVSVIVPVFNVEKYLRQCLDSILQQTYQNLEIIIIMMAQQMEVTPYAVSMLVRIHEYLTLQKKILGFLIQEMSVFVKQRVSM